MLKYQKYLSLSPSSSNFIQIISPRQFRSMHARLFLRVIPKPSSPLFRAARRSFFGTPKPATPFRAHHPPRAMDWLLGNHRSSSPVGNAGGRLNDFKSDLHDAYRSMNTLERRLWNEAYSTTVHQLGLRPNMEWNRGIMWTCKWPAAALTVYCRNVGPADTFRYGSMRCRFPRVAVRSKGRDSARYPGGIPDLSSTNASTGLDD